MDKVYPNGTPDYKRIDSRSQVSQATADAERESKCRAPLVVTTAARMEVLASLRKRRPGSSTSAQVDKILDALSTGTLNTFEARQHLGIPHPAGRVQQLRDRGHEIFSEWVRVVDEFGGIHKVSQYSMVPGSGTSGEVAA